ncbi:MAG: thioredoxin domain-containing protein, partial [Tepidiformaceae bacterium]
GFFETSTSGEALIVRQKSFFDAATPSGNGAMSLLTLWIGRYYLRPEGEHVAREVLTQVHDHLLQAPTGFGTLWQAVQFMLAPSREVVIVGEPAERQPLEAEVARFFGPWVAVAPSTEGAGLPMFEGRLATGAALAYVCEEMVCQLPVSSVEALRAQLES